MEETQASATHSAEPIQATTTETAATVTTQEAPPNPEGIKVKYNHEERIIGLDEAPSWIQKGLNYDKLQGQADQFEQHSRQLERAAKYHGFPSTEAYLQAIEESEQQLRIEDEARRLGVDQSVVLEHLQPLREQVDELTKTKQELESERQQFRIQQELVDLRAKYPDFDQYGDKIVGLVQSKGYALEDAYILASHHDKLSKIQQETEANTIRGLTNNATSSPGALGAEGAEEKSGYMSMSKDERRQFRERVKRGEVTSI
ncbi:hypothetical protein ACTHPH_24010 [Paenibacillus pasadenensis]|uniref:hypothetical protein n=1 Tax=Paenibacillus pasadenensis TaxID=217090 RepID=UPI00049146AC|nr:hypothetical protein [Paenibacillus pasadenensis]